MANPQKENGHIDIANEIAEYLSRFRISGEEHQILWTIWRKTYGWHKKEDSISLSQFFLSTGMKKPSIIRAIKKLEDKNIISKRANNIAYIYRFNKDFDTWKPLAKRLTVSKRANVVSKRANKSLAKELPTKENYTKETITKEITKQPAVADSVNQVFNLFHDSLNPTINYGNTTQRKAVEYLIAKMGAEKLTGLVKYAISVQGRKYAPTITTPYQLKEKLASLMIFYKKNHQRREVVKL